MIDSSTDTAMQVLPGNAHPDFNDPDMVASPNKWQQIGTMAVVDLTAVRSADMDGGLLEQRRRNDADLPEELERAQGKLHARKEQAKMAGEQNYIIGREPSPLWIDPMAHETDPKAKRVRYEENSPLYKETPVPIHIDGGKVVIDQDADIGNTDPDLKRIPVDPLKREATSSKYGFYIRDDGVCAVFEIGAPEINAGVRTEPLDVGQDIDPTNTPVPGDTRVRGVGGGRDSSIPPPPRR